MTGNPLTLHGPQDGVYLLCLVTKEPCHLGVPPASPGCPAGPHCAGTSWRQASEPAPRGAHGLGTRHSAASHTGGAPTPCRAFREPAGEAGRLRSGGGRAAAESSLPTLSSPADHTETGVCTSPGTRCYRQSGLNTHLGLCSGGWKAEVGWLWGPLSSARRQGFSLCIGSAFVCRHDLITSFI